MGFEQAGQLILPRGESSQLTHYQPRHAVIAAIPAHKKYERVVDQVAKKVRNRQSQLPITHLEFMQRARSTQ
jgi:hypothetical protein